MENLDRKAMELKKEKLRNSIIEILRKTKKPMLINEIYEVLRLSNKTEWLEYDKIKRVIWELEERNIINRIWNRWPYTFRSFKNENYTIKDIILNYIQYNKEMYYKDMFQILKIYWYNEKSILKYINELIKEWKIQRIKKWYYKFLW